LAHRRERELSATDLGVPGAGPGGRGHARRGATNVDEKLKPFKEQVAEDIRESDEGED
jgi:hypothetical protein